MLKHRLPRDSEIIPNRAEKIIVSPTHFVNGRRQVGMGCDTCAVSEPHRR